MKAICINDKDRPESIPLSLFVVKGQIYTVIEVSIDMNGIEYYVLEEISLTSIGTLYKGFAKSRFAPIENTNKVVKQYQTVDA